MQAYEVLKETSRSSMKLNCEYNQATPSLRLLLISGKANQGAGARQGAVASVHLGMPCLEMAMDLQVTDAWGGGRTWPKFQCRRPLPYLEVLSSFVIDRLGTSGANSRAILHDRAPQLLSGRGRMISLLLLLSVRQPSHPSSPAH